MSLLARFLGTVPVADVQALLDARRWRYFPCGGGERLAGLVTWDDAIALLNMADVTAPTGLSLCKEGQPVPNRWLTRLSGQKAPQGDAFAALARQKFTFFLHRQDQKSPRLARLRREAEQVFPGLALCGTISQDYLAWLERQAQALKPFRRQVPYGADENALPEYEAKLRPQIRDLIDRHSPSVWLAALRQQRGREISAEDLPPDLPASETNRR